MIQGKWYSEGSAASSKARLLSDDDVHYVIELGDGRKFDGLLSDLKVGNRLGNVERKIMLKDGSLFATKENDKVDSLFKNRLKTNKLIHTLESHMGWVMVALVVTALSTFAFFKWGVPWASKTIAHALPHKSNQIIAANTLEFLDDYMFEKTKLSEDKMEKIRTHFKTNIVPLSVEDKDIKYTLHFRRWNNGSQSIPNALALPSGDIVLTDKFVELCKTQDEMDSVLLHEIGHVVHRHSLEMVIEGTFVSVAVMLMVGDSSGMADMGVGLGSLLVSSAYSRGHEAEADIYAFKHMLTANIDPEAFSTIMNRMTSYMEGTAKQKTDKKETRDKKDKKQSKEKNIQESKAKESNSILDYLSSHPSTKKRVEIARQYSECFKKGLKECKVDVLD